MLPSQQVQVQAQATVAVLPPESSNSNNSCDQLQLPWPLFDLFLDVPHPAASASCPPPYTVLSPDFSGDELSPTVLSQISRFAFPEYDGPDGPVGQQQQQQSQQQPQEQPSPTVPLNRFDHYAMQGAGFQHFTFTLQLSSGTRLHGHVRRYLPMHRYASTRYDVGRRGERALVLLTKSAGADALYAAILKSVEAISSQQAALAKNKDENLQPRSEPQKWFLFALSRYQQHLASVYISRPFEERGKPLIAALEGLELGLHAQHNKLYKQIDVTRFIIPTSLLHRPASLGLDPSSTLTHASSSKILPLLRCIRITHVLRLMAALLSERRVILMSHSPTRLSHCSHAALAILAQGMLHWQHLYIPVLPPHLWPYLAAPYPYLIGILTTTAPKLDRTDGLGEVLILNLDQDSMETRGMDTATIAQRLPDLFYCQPPQQQLQSQFQQQSQVMISSVMASATGGGGGGGVDAIPTTTISASECLAQDLAEVIKNDKRLLQGETTLANMSMETAAKTVVAVKNTFSKLRDKVATSLNNTKNFSSSSSFGYSASGGGSGSGGGTGGSSSSLVAAAGVSGSSSTIPPDDDSSETMASAATATRSLAADYIFTEGCHNETCEEEARVAFATFFLCMFGNMRWYLTPASAPGQVPQLDRNRFLQQKRALGDGEGTAMWALLQNFVQTQMLEEFAKARVEELRTRQPLTPDAPLFAKCAHFHRQQNIDFHILSVRRVCQQVSSTMNPASRITGLLQTNARRSAMALTANKPFEGGDYQEAIATLVEQCRECSSVLLDVMSVIWLRLRDSSLSASSSSGRSGIVVGGGINMKHASQALALLRNLLYHGPLGAITEATDGLDKIRALKFYENTGMGRAQGAQQIRAAAAEVYDVLVDRAKLFRIRRFCAERRRQLSDATPRPQRDPRMTLNAPFRTLHTFASPVVATGTIVRIPPAPAPSRVDMDRGISAGGGDGRGVAAAIQQQQQQPARLPEPTEDLLGISSPNPVAASSTPVNDDIFGLTSAAVAPSPSPSVSSFGGFGDTTTTSNAASDVLGLFDSLSVSSGVSTPLSAPQPADPFGGAQTTPPPSAPAPVAQAAAPFGVVAPQQAPTAAVAASTAVSPSWSGPLTASSGGMPTPPSHPHPTHQVSAPGVFAGSGPLQQPHQQQQYPVQMAQSQQQGGPISSPSTPPVLSGGQQLGPSTQPYPTYQYQQQTGGITSGPPSHSPGSAVQQQPPPQMHLSGPNTQQNQTYQSQQQPAMHNQQQQQPQFAFPPQQHQAPPPQQQGHHPQQQHYFAGASPQQRFGASSPPAIQPGAPQAPPQVTTQYATYQQQQQYPPFHQQQQQQLPHVQHGPPHGPFGGGPPTSLATPTAYSGQQPYPFGAASPPLPQQQPSTAAPPLGVSFPSSQQQQNQQPARRSQFDPFA